MSRDSESTAARALTMDARPRSNQYACSIEVTSQQAGARAVSLSQAAWLIDQVMARSSTLVAE